MDTQRFTFDTREDEEPPPEVPLEQPIEATQAEVELEAIPSDMGEDVVEVASPPRGQIITSSPESTF